MIVSRRTVRRKGRTGECSECGEILYDGTLQVLVGESFDVYEDGVTVTRRRTRTLCLRCAKGLRVESP